MKNANTHTDDVYASVECPTCLAYFRERCRDPKTQKYMKDSFHDKRKAIVDSNIEKRARQSAEDLRLSAERVAAGDPRAHNFLSRYRKLCEETGIAFSHEDTHGSFVLKTTNLPYLLAWALEANQKLGPLSPEERLGLEAHYAKLREIESASDYLIDFSKNATDKLNEMRTLLDQARASKDSEKCVEFVTKYGIYLESILPELRILPTTRHYVSRMSEGDDDLSTGRIMDH